MIKTVNTSPRYKRITLLYSILYISYVYLAPISLITITLFFFFFRSINDNAFRSLLTMNVNGKIQNSLQQKQNNSTRNEFEIANTVAYLFLYKV